MTTVKNVKELEKVLQQLQSKINKVQLQNVAPVVKGVMKEKIEEEVYSVYDPTMYERDREHGGLLDEANMEVTMLNETTLSVENIRSDNGRNVAEIVETGEGYDFEFMYNGIPRPFTEATREELRNTNEHIHAMYAGLKKQGINVKIK
ncbi:hypothetical protein [Paenibacillus lautus]|uniref:hypothetical protein n=1 Tax=Paenibacillus lautus TaxID=1401 RepID=UPI001C7D3ED6|nr:hypothetical protein [Paenibacillus lautus]MBX4152349.1 hypothetical protein [Paenibacillus lautus]